MVHANQDKNGELRNQLKKMGRLFHTFVFCWVVSVFSPNNNAMKTNLTCEFGNGNIGHTCNFTAVNVTEVQTYCNISLSTILGACNKTGGNLSCNTTNNASKCDENDKKPRIPYKDDMALIAAQMTCYAAVFVVGVTGNSLVLLTVTSKRMRSVRNMLIGNLAVADLITLVVCLPLSVVTLFVSWPFGTFVCRYIFPVTDVVVSVSILTLCVITMDRFRAIVYPFAKKMTLKITLMVFVMIWLLSYLMVALPLLHLMNVVPTRSGRSVCVPMWPSKLYEKVYRLVILIVLYIVPVTLVFFCFICIVKRIRENIRFTRETVRDSRSLARVKRRSRVVRMMFVIFITFTICLLPIHLLLTLMVFYPPTKFWPPINKLYHAALVVLTANSAMNPIILYLLSSEFKRGFKENCICFVLFIRCRGVDEAPMSKPSRSFNNQQLTTCLHIPAAHNDMPSGSSNAYRNGQRQELIDKRNHNHNHNHENGNLKVKANGAETEL